MKKALVLILFLIVLGCNRQVRRADALGVRFQQTVNAMLALTGMDDMSALSDNLEFPRHFEKKDARKQGGEFDVQIYFSILKHVSLKEGYVLDYVYYYGAFDGNPVLYTRRKDQKPYATLTELTSAMKDKGEKPFDQRINLDHVRIDGTKEGYLEYVALHILGGQFYLRGHSAFLDYRIISDKDGLRDLFGIPTQRYLGTLKLPFTPLETAVLKAERIDFSPRVKIKGTEAHVSIVTFTKWGGFKRNHFTINTQFPHKIEKETEEVLVPYECEICF